MSDTVDEGEGFYEDDDDSQQSYRYESASDDEGDFGSSVKRQRENDTDDFCHRRKYLDGGESDMRIWSEGNSVRMAISAAIRQVADHPSGKLSVLFSVDSLFGDEKRKTFRIFVAVCPTMNVTYDLIFCSTSEIKEAPPILKCTT